MKSTRSRNASPATDIKPEYDLDWSKARPNPYAARLKDTVAVVLDPDVAEVFHTSASVNTFLRSVISAVPRKSNASRSSKRRVRHPRKGRRTERSS
jgi:hypothetical protein